MSKKTLLKESQIRHFMKLANIEPLAPGLISNLKLNEQLDDEEAMEEDPMAGMPGEAADLGAEDLGMPGGEGGEGGAVGEADRGFVEKLVQKIADAIEDASGLQVDVEGEESAMADAEGMPDMGDMPLGMDQGAELPGDEGPEDELAMTAEAKLRRYIRGQVAGLLSEAAQPRRRSGVKKKSNGQGRRKARAVSSRRRSRPVARKQVVLEVKRKPRNSNDALRMQVRKHLARIMQEQNQATVTSTTRPDPRLRGREGRPTRRAFRAARGQGRSAQERAAVDAMTADQRRDFFRDRPADNPYLYQDDPTMAQALQSSNVEGAYQDMSPDFLTNPRARDAWYGTDPVTGVRTEEGAWPSELGSESQGLVLQPDGTFLDELSGESYASQADYNERNPVDPVPRTDYSGFESGQRGLSGDEFQHYLRQSQGLGGSLFGGGGGHLLNIGPESLQGTDAAEIRVGGDTLGGSDLKFYRGDDGQFYSSEEARERLSPPKSAHPMDAETHEGDDTIEEGAHSDFSGAGLADKGSNSNRDFEKGGYYKDSAGEHHTGGGKAKSSRQHMGGNSSGLPLEESADKDDAQRTQDMIHRGRKRSTSSVVDQMHPYRAGDTRGEQSATGEEKEATEEQLQRQNDLIEKLTRRVAARLLDTRRR